MQVHFTGIKLPFLSVLLNLVFVATALVGLPDQAGAQSKLVLSTFEKTPLTKEIKPLVEKAYLSIGIEIEVIELPALRAINAANYGDTDGELVRIEGIQKDYPNLMMIPVKLSQIEAVAFTKNYDFRVEGRESLKSYSVAIRRGAKFAERATAGLNPTIITSLPHAFLLLEKERVDFVISTRRSGLKVLDQLPYKGIKTLEPPLLKIDLYHYLNSKHKALIPAITQALQKTRNRSD